MTRAHRITLLGLLAAAFCSAPLQAQISPQQAVRKIADEVQTQMREIDRLLLESSRAREGGEGVRELMGRTKESQQTVVEGIDRLIDELQNLARQQQSSSSQSQQGQQGEQGGEPQDRGEPQPGGEPRGSGTRREIETTELAEQANRGEQPRPEGQQQEQPQPGERADDGRQTQDPDRNTATGAAREGGTESVEREADAERWGDLQKYMPPEYHRAGAPEVPAKYRRLHEAFQRRAHEKREGR